MNKSIQVLIRLAEQQELAADAIEEAGDAESAAFVRAKAVECRTLANDKVDEEITAARLDGRAPAGWAVKEVFRSDNRLTAHTEYQRLRSVGKNPIWLTTTGHTAKLVIGLPDYAI